MRRTPVRNHGRTPRRATRLACQLVRERDFKLVGDSIIDLSPSGLLVAPADPVLTGEQLLISFQLPQSSFWVDCDVIVTRVVHGRRPGEYSRALGLTFEGMSDAARCELECALRHLPPLPPGNRPGRRMAPRQLVRELARSWPNGADSLPAW